MSIVNINHVKSERTLESPHLPVHILRASILQGLTYLAENLRDDLWDSCLQNGVGISLIFSRSSFIDNLSKVTKTQIPWDPFIKKNSAHHFEDHVCTNKLEYSFFSKIFFSCTWSFFRECKTTDLGFIFILHKKMIFFKSDYLILV